MNQSNQSGRWYEPVNPNEHCYTPGYGFSSQPPFLVEQRLISRYSTAAALALLGSFFLGSFIPNFLLKVAYMFLPLSAPYSVDEFLWQCFVMIGSIVSLLLPFGLFASYTRIPRNCATPIRWVDMRIVCCAVMAAMGVSVIGNYACSAMDELFYRMGIEFFSGYELPESIPAFVVYAINMTIIPAIFEEIAFRGILMQTLRRFGDSFALLVSALLFSLVHVLPVSMPNAFIMGLIIGYFVLFTGSLTIGMIIHFIYNTTVLCSGLFAYLPMQAETIAYQVLDLLMLLVGFAALVELLRRYPDLFALKHSTTVNPGEQKLKVFLCSMPMFVFYVVVIFEATRYRI